MPRKILIVDDISINRQILNGMLNKTYDILEAASGEETLEILAREYESVSAVLLDIGLPGMDGYEVLRKVRSNSVLAQLPVIIITGNEDEESRVKSLALGANDFVMKPYKSDIIKHCLKNNIALHEAAATVTALQRDKLTGLYGREAFFDRVAEMVAASEPGHYMLTCFDVDKFKVINDQYGTQKGDDVLRHIAREFESGFEPHGGICCRISSDNFAVIYPASFTDSDELVQIRKRASRIDWLISPIVFSIGRYHITDKTMSPSAMYDRAMLASDTIKGRYDLKIIQYDDSMRDRLLHEQEIVSEMEAALSDRQFEVWFQPQYNHSTAAMIGAEALVRWKHPQKGLIQPSEFIPVFESNGFIYELDKFVWEESCRCLRKWMDAGRNPLPVSVNVSRYDMLQPDIADVISGIVDKYRLNVGQLRLEVTESAFSQATGQIIKVVKCLIDRGFTVEIDDFGSGYSSLNTLKDVPAQIIKLDMRFLEAGSGSERGGNIIESVVRMAKWLNMSVIAEGVETMAQADYLRSIGCYYVQGYLYARPMSVEKYEEHCGGAVKEEKLLTLETVENLDNNSFWDPASMDTLIFNSYVGGACIYEYHNGSVELLRATEKYAQMLGSDEMTVEKALKLNWSEHMDAGNLKRLAEYINESVRTRGEVIGEYVFTDLPGCPYETHLRSTMRVIAVAGDRYLVYCTNENITAQRKAEEQERRMAEQMQAIMDNVDLGIIAAAVEGDTARYLFANDRYYELLGYTKQQFAAEIDSPFRTIAPEDREKVKEAALSINHDGGSASLIYDAVTRDGRRIILRAAITTCRLSGEEGPVQLSLLRDVTEEEALARRERQMAEQLQTMVDDMPGGFVRMRVADDGSVRPVYMNKGFLRLVGMSSDEVWQIYENDALEGVHPDDVGVVNEVVTRMLAQGEAQSARYRLRKGDGGYVWLSVFGRVTQTDAGERYLNIYYTDATEQVRTEETQRELLDNLPGGAGLYELENGRMNLIYQNKSFWELVGLKEEDKFPDPTPMSALHPDDIPVIMREVAAAIEKKRDITCDVRLRHLTLGYRRVHLVGRIIPTGEGKYSIYTTFTPISDMEA